MKKILFLSISLYSFIYANYDYEYNGYIFTGSDHYREAKKRCNFGVGTVINSNPDYFTIVTKVTYKGTCSSNYAMFHYYQFEAVSYIEIPQCSDNQVVENGVCVCDTGYHENDNGSCIPDIDCPSPMVYKYINRDWGFDIKGCFPDKNISQSECNNIPGSVYLSLGDDVDDTLNQYAFVFGSGCANAAYLNDKVSNFNLSFLVSGLLPNSMYVGEALSSLFISGKNFISDVLKAFSKSPDNPTLLLDKPKVIDMKIGDDGVYYAVEPEPMSPIEPNNVDSVTTAYNDYLRENGYINITDEILPNPIVESDFPTSSINFDLYYRGGDSLDFTDNMIGTANMSDKGVLPDVSILDSLNVGSQTQTTVKLFEDFTQTLQKDFPLDIVKVSQTNEGGNVVSNYNGVLRFPDGSNSNIKIVKTTYADGTSVSEVHIFYDVNTPSGYKTFNTYYTVNTDSSGVVTNYYNGSSSVGYSTPSGYVTTTNNPVTSNVPTEFQQSSIDLTPAIQKLDAINNSINTLNGKIDDLVNYRPPNANQADITIKEFGNALNIFDANFNDYKNFISGIKDNMLDLKNQFEDAKRILEDKPTLQEVNGQCGFNASFFHRTYYVDPCRYVAPYRPFLALIFTFVGSLMVVNFATKHLVSKGS